MVSAVLLVGLAIAFAPGPKGNAEKAKSDFEKARRYFEAEEYAAALPYFQSAYELSNHRPSTILALAQCERFLKRYEDALVHYREYLASKPTPKDSRAVKETVALVEDLVKDERARAAAAAAAQPQTPAIAKTEPPKIVEQPKPKETPPLPQPTAAPQAAPQSAPVLVASPPPADDGDSILSSPIFWVGTAAVVAGGAVALAFALSPSGPSPYGGSSGVIATP